MPRPLLAALSLALACSSTPSPPATPEAAVAAPATPDAAAPAPAPARWTDALPVVSSPELALALDLRAATAIVGIDADGTIRLGDQRRGDDPLGGAPPATAAALVAALPRSDRGGGGSSWGDRGGLGHPATRTGAPTPPSRLTTTTGRWLAMTADRAVVILADAAAPASAAIDLLARSGGVIGVRHGDELRALALRFENLVELPPMDGSWVEVRLDTHAFVERVPGAPTVIPWPGGRHDEIAGAVAPHATHAVDVLVSERTDVQTLVEVVVALRGVGVTAVGLGRLPDRAEAEARGEKGTRVVAHPPELIGDLDPVEVGIKVATAHRALRDDARRGWIPRSDRTLWVRMAIDPDGRVDRVAIQDPDGELAATTMAAVTAAFQSCRFSPAAGPRAIRQSIAIYD